MVRPLVASGKRLEVAIWKQCGVDATAASPFRLPSFRVEMLDLMLVCASVTKIVFNNVQTLAIWQ